LGRFVKHRPNRLWRNVAAQSNVSNDWLAAYERRCIFDDSRETGGNSPIRRCCHWHGAATV